jgi:hypothetical protein
VAAGAIKIGQSDQQGGTLLSRDSPALILFLVTLSDLLYFGGYCQDNIERLFGKRKTLLKRCILATS